VWSIPMQAIRELVINAIVHASYAEQGAPIRVSFFDDRIEVENPGDLLPSVTVESMKAIFLTICRELCRLRVLTEERMPMICTQKH